MPLTTKSLDQIAQDFRTRIPFPALHKSDPSLTFAELKRQIEDRYTFFQKNGVLVVAQNLNDLRNVFNTIEQQPDENHARVHLTSAIEKALKSGILNVALSPDAGPFFVRLQRALPEAVDTAYSYYTDTLGNVRIWNSAQFDGAIAASLSKNPDFASGGLDDKVTAFDEQRRRLDGVLRDAEKSITDIRTEAADLSAASKKEVGGLIEGVRNEFVETKNNWDRTFTQFQEKVKEDSTKLRDELVGIKNAYNDQLSLQEPAQYWMDLEDKYVKSGRVWVGLAFLLIASLVLLVGLIVYSPPGLLTDEKAVLGGIKGAIFIGAALSMVIYGINLLFKLSISSFHLARDARERFQLTRVFLALLKNNSMEPKERDTVLGALFSGADTGLLRDSSPTLTTPLGAVIEHFKTIAR